MKDALKTSDNSLRTKMEFETSYADVKYFLDALANVKDTQIKERMLNCLLISRHFMLVLQLKNPDFTDYPNSKKSVEEKEEICAKYARSQ